MSTFADQAVLKTQEVKKLILSLREEIVGAKPQVRDPEALALLTQLQTRMLTIGTDLAQLSSLIGTASMVGEFRHASRTQIYPDAGMAAAHDDTLFPDR